MKLNRITKIACLLGCVSVLMCGTDTDNGTNPNNNNTTNPIPNAPGTYPGTINPNNPSGWEDTTDYGVGAGYIPAAVDTVGRSGLEDGSAARLAQTGVAQYYWGDVGNGTEIPLVKITHAVSTQVVDVELVLNPGFVDNSYGTGAIGWSPNRGHTFDDLVKSDHVEIRVTNGNGETVFFGRLDLITQKNGVESGYASLGPFGGDGSIVEGDPSNILSYGTSMDDNLNYYDYHLYTNSPATDSVYTPNPQYPNWQFYPYYHITFKASAFGPSGYGEVVMTYVHASPAKTPSETVSIVDKPFTAPGGIDDPFRYFIPTRQLLPPDTTTPAPIDTTPPPDTLGVD